MKPVIWSKESIVSIQNIYDYIVEKSPQNADLVVDTLFDLGDKLNIFPEKIQENHFTIKIPSDFFQSGISKLFIELNKIEFIFLMYFQH